MENYTLNDFKTVAHSMIYGDLLDCTESNQEDINGMKNFLIGLLNAVNDVLSSNPDNGNKLMKEVFVGMEGKTIF